MNQWAKAPAPRHQLVLIAQTLDDLVAADHPVRLLDDSLGELDWRGWEGRYDGHRGQPPVHPRLVAGAILYGLMKRVRSSRDLEEATRERLDFKWLWGGRTIDHSTFAGFRTRFEKELKDLNKQVARAMVNRAEAAAIVEPILDGTRIRANSDRSGARSAASLEKLIAACAEELNAKLESLGRKDAQRDEVRRERGETSTPVRVPVSDPDSTILPNKEGGFAPNYTPTAVVESRSAFLYDAQADRYDCPMGKPLLYEKQGHYHRTGVAYRAYACPGKEGCPLAGQCVKADAGHPTVSRDQYQDVRDRVARRMAGETGRAIYRKRAPAIEGVFGLVKQSFGIRQFLLRGLEKVRTECNWICGAYNLRKMLRLLQANPAGPSGWAGSTT